MKMKSSLVVAFMVLTTWCFSQSLEWAYQTSYEVNDVAVDASGNVYSTGYFGFTTDFDMGPGVVNLTPVGSWDAFVTKHDASGNLIWAKSIGSTGNDYGLGIAVNADGVYFCGTFENTIDLDPSSSSTVNQVSEGQVDAFVVRLSLDGDFWWGKGYGGPGNDTANDVAADNSGVLVTGGFVGSLTIETNPSNITITNSSSSSTAYFGRIAISGGQVLHMTQFETTSLSEGMSIVSDMTGGLLRIYIAGYFSGQMDLNGPPQGTISSVGGQNSFLIKTDVTGYVMWAHAMTNTGFGTNRAHELGIDVNNNLYLAGNLTDPVDFDPSVGVGALTSAGSYLAKFDTDGNFQWVYGVEAGQYYSYATGVMVNSNGEAFLSGYFANTMTVDATTSAQLLSPSEYSVFLVKLTASGAYYSAQKIGENENAYSYGAAMDANGNIYLAGSFNGIVDFDNSAAVHNLDAANGNAFLLKLGECTPVTGTDVRSECDELVWIDGNTYYSSNNTATYTLPNSAGCDSTVTLNLTILVSTFSTQSETATGSYTWPVNNQTYTSGGQYTAVIQNAAGCDSTITLDLTLNMSGLTESTIESLRYFPNPTSKVFNIQSSAVMEGEYMVYDLNGRMLLSGKVEGLTTEINVESLKEGTYMVRFTNYLEVVRFMKM